MMTNKRKGFIAAAISLVMLISPFGTMDTRAASNIINETSAKQTLTQGVTLENIVRFTTGGWYNIEILRVDLSNQYIKVDTLSSSDSIGKVSSVRSMASLSGAIAAINASFFTPDGGSKGHPVGTIIKSGELISASNDINKYSDSMASLSITKLNELLFSYCKADINLIAPDSTTIAVSQYNKPSTNKSTDFCVYDKKWGVNAIGATTDMPDVVQMVVDGGIVTQMLYSQPAVQIPENGFVVVTRADGGTKLAASYAVGDPASMDITTNPDWNNINMSLSGSSLLVKDGQIPSSFSFNPSDISTSSPKTGIGSSEDGKQLIVATVDGRQTSSIGLSQADFAQLMLDVGAYNAINMDGGGSTTMVARPLGNTSVQVMNSPSDGSSRSVSTALGIFSVAPPSSLAGLIIDTEDSNIFINTSRAFTVRAYDKYFNPLTVDPASIKWSVSGVKGTFSNNVFHPKSYGEGRITAKVGSVTATLPISVLSTPAMLALSNKNLKMPLGQSKAFSVEATNKNGYSALLSSSDVKWSVKGNVGKISSDGIFTAAAKGTGYIDASIGSTHAYCTLSVAADTPSIKDHFETANGSFVSYPDTVQGAYGISTDYFHSGKASGMLTYDFSTNMDGTRAAYFVLANGGVKLDNGSSKIGVWVYNDHPNSNWIRAEINDSNGNKQMAGFTKSMDWTGWQYVEASLDGISLPAKLTKLYVVQTNPVAESGSIYFDDLTVVNSGYPTIGMDKIHNDTVAADDSNKAVSFTKATATSFRFGVFGQSRAPKNALEKLLMTNFAKKVDSYLDNAVIVGSGSHESLTKLIKKKKVMAGNTVNLVSTKNVVDYKYSYTDIKNSRFFKLDTRNNGLRCSDPAQWSQFQKDLNSFKGNNVFLMMEESPENFSDKLELNFFKDTLTKYMKKTGKAVWVFYKGSKNVSYMESGIKYISTVGYQVDNLTPNKASAATYVLVTVKGSTVTYTYKSIN